MEEEELQQINAIYEAYQIAEYWIRVLEHRFHNPSLRLAWLRAQTEGWKLYGISKH